MTPTPPADSKSAPEPKCARPICGHEWVNHVAIGEDREGNPTGAGRCVRRIAAPDGTGMNCPCPAFVPPPSPSEEKERK